MQQAPSESQKSALIFQLVTSYSDFSQQLEIFSIKHFHQSAPTSCARMKNGAALFTANVVFLLFPNCW
jgi:hypothetical protein